MQRNIVQRNEKFGPRIGLPEGQQQCSAKEWKFAGQPAERKINSAWVDKRMNRSQPLLKNQVRGAGGASNNLLLASGPGVLAQE
jgi:hypothetical protein